MRVRIVLALIVVMAIAGFGCASFSRNAYNTLSASTILYNATAAAAEANTCEIHVSPDGTITEVVTGTCITADKWDHKVRPAIKLAHDTIDDGDTHLAAYNHAKTSENKTTLQAILDRIPGLINDIKNLVSEAGGN